MYISPIFTSNIGYINQYNKAKPNFTAHPDLKFSSTQSCFFRRGVVALSNPQGYAHIEKLFHKIFSANNGLKNMLIIGIGASQEPFSYLCSIKGILSEKPLNKNLSMYTVDLQSQPDEKTLERNSFCDLFDYETFPEYAGKSFIQNKKTEKKETNDLYMYPAKLLLLRTKPKEDTRLETRARYSDYRVNDEIFDYVKDTYNNPQKSVWESRIQEVIPNYPDEKFDIISANNTLPYIQSLEEVLLTLKNINRTLKPGGYFITDAYKMLYIQNSHILDNTKEIFPGIYQKQNH